MKTFIIGDIHGHYRALRSALSVSEYQQGDRLICLGDYTNVYAHDCAGSISVLDFLIDQANLVKHNVFIRGNHEKMLMSALLMDSDERHGTSEIHRKEFLDYVTEAHKMFLSKTVQRYEEGQFIFVHDAEGMPAIPGKIIVAGHFHAPTPIVKKGFITIASTKKVFVIDQERLKVRDNEGREYDTSSARW